MTTQTITPTVDIDKPHSAGGGYVGAISVGTSLMASVLMFVTTVPGPTTMFAFAPAAVAAAYMIVLNYLDSKPVTRHNLKVAVFLGTAVTLFWVLVFTWLYHGAGSYHTLGMQTGFLGMGPFIKGSTIGLLVGLAPVGAFHFLMGYVPAKK